MNIKIEFNTDNAAFEDFESEIHHVLSSIEKILFNYCNIDRYDFYIFDSNGNCIGKTIIGR